jgi:hypothetical protein
VTLICKGVDTVFGNSEKTDSNIKREKIGEI